MRSRAGLAAHVELIDGGGTVPEANDFQGPPLETCDLALAPGDRDAARAALVGEGSSTRKSG